MTRPDPRLLVDCNLLPFVPEGARLWSKSRFFPDAFVMQEPLITFGLLLDLSEPAVRDRLPSRLDALPWALAVLGWREAPTVGKFGYVAPLYTARPDAVDFPRWSDLDLAGLAPDEAQRAVVAAALRGGR
jgi:hypothetical protein